MNTRTTQHHDRMPPARSGNSLNRVQPRTFRKMFVSLLIVQLFCSGCHLPGSRRQRDASDDVAYYQAASRQIEFPDLEQPVPSEAGLTVRPVSMTTDLQQLDYWNLSLQEMVQLGLKHSKVMRNLGTTILRSPDAVASTFDPAIRETDPRFGVQAALAAFDASFAASVFHQNNDRALNNQFFGGGTRILQQEATVMQGQLSKQSASGTQYFLRNITDYDKNNAPGNAFPGAWTSVVETEVRQPLLRGYGVEYWQTVGASQTPGVYTGVLIARTHTDISESEFEIAVRDFIAEIENSYWDLYYAYQDLDAKIAARDASLELWRRLDALNQLGRAGGEADKEAQAREQYFRFEEDVQNAMNGRPVEGTKTFNGTSAGSFRGSMGVLNAERRLRYLSGLPINDERLIRPADEPLNAPVVFDWECVMSDGLQLRPELRRQKWVVKQKELELIGSQKLMLPELDVVGLYRWRGFGETLTNPSAGGAPRFDSAWGDLASGNFQEWQLGVELEVPLGNRRAHAGIRNAEFQLARARQVLKDQERLVVHDLSNSISEMDRAWKVLQTVRQRLKAAEDQVNAMVAAFEADQAPVNLVLEAQRRYASARSAYYAAVLDYHFAIRNVHFEKGSYLDYCGVHLSEGEWSQDAYRHAARMKNRELIHERMPPFVHPAPTISQGQVPVDSQSILIDAHPLNGHAFEAEQAPFPASSSDMPADVAPGDMQSPAASPMPAPRSSNSSGSRDPLLVPPVLDPPTNPTGAATSASSGTARFDLPPVPPHSAPTGLVF